MAYVTKRFNEIKPKRTIWQRKRRQMLSSISHYWFEISRFRSLKDVYEWVYYKFPTCFPLRYYPSVMNFEITNVCNFSCPHCPRNFLNRERDLGFMRLDLFNRIIEECSGRISAVKLIGLGEPSLHPELDAFMRTLKRHDIKTLLYTNGTLFEKFAPETICEWGADEIVVSIDGVDARSFERLRVGGNFAQIYANLERFHAFRVDSGKNSPSIEVRHVIMPSESPEELSGFTAYWSRFADTVKYCFLGEPYERLRLAARQRPSCRDIRRELHVRYDGRTPLCGYEGHREWIGDLASRDLASTTVKQLWHSGRITQVRACHQKGDLSTLEMCKTCQFW